MKYFSSEKLEPCVWPLREVFLILYTCERDIKRWPQYGVERWPLNRGFFTPYILGAGRDVGGAKAVELPEVE